MAKEYYTHAGNLRVLDLHQRLPAGAKLMIDVHEYRAEKDRLHARLESLSNMIAQVINSDNNTPTDKNTLRLAVSQISSIIASSRQGAL